MQIEHGYYGAFTATIQAFGVGGGLLGSASRQGVGTSAADGSAIFLGIWSDEGNIQRLVINSISLVNRRDGEFAINYLSVAIVPEPSSIVLFGLGVVAVGALRKKWQMTC